MRQLKKYQSKQTKVFEHQFNPRPDKRELNLAFSKLAGIVMQNDAPDFVQTCYRMKVVNPGNVGLNLQVFEEQEICQNFESNVSQLCTWLQKDCLILKQNLQRMELLESNSKMQANLMNDLLDFAQNENAKFRLNHTFIDIPQTLKMAFQVVEPKLKEKGLALDFKLDEV